MPTTDNHEDTPWEPLSIRERVCFAIVRAILFVFQTDFFDMYRRQEVRYDERDGFYRIGMGPISDLKDEWLDVYKTQAEYYDDNEDNDWVPYAMWLVMRSDKTINPPTVLHGERTDDGWEVETNEKPPEDVKRERKEAILRDIDGRGFIDPVLEED